MATQPRYDYIVTIKLNTGELKNKEINATTAHMAVRMAERQFAKEGIRKADYTDLATLRINISATIKA